MTDTPTPPPMPPLPRAHLARPLALGILVTIVLGALLTIYLATRTPGQPKSPLLPFVIPVTLAIAAGLGISLAAHLDRTRLKALAIFAQDLDLDVVVKPPKEKRARLFTPFQALPMLKQGAKGVRSWLGGHVQSRRIDVIEHQYVVSTGKSAHAVLHTAIATPCPSSWPALSLVPRNALLSLWTSVTGNDFRVESEAFNGRWVIKTESPDFALVFLTPEVQALLATTPTAGTWHVAGGSLCFVARQRIKLPDLPGAMEALTTLRSTLPPELDHWTNSDNASASRS